MDRVPFGRYRGLRVEAMLKDKGYCVWLLDQPWLHENYPELVPHLRPLWKFSQSYQAGWQEAGEFMWGTVSPHLPEELKPMLMMTLEGCTCTLIREDPHDHDQGCPYADKIARQAKRERMAAQRAQKPKCAGRRSDGRPCQAIVSGGDRYCHVHADQTVREDLAGEALAYLASREAA